MGEPSRRVWPGSSQIVLAWACGMPSMDSGASAPVTATATVVSVETESPPSRHSTPAADLALPTSLLPSAKAARSAAPAWPTPEVSSRSGRGPG